jgi:hypothetical protein
MAKRASLEFDCPPPAALALRRLYKRLAQRAGLADDEFRGLLVFGLKAVRKKKRKAARKTRKTARKRK